MRKILFLGLLFVGLGVANVQAQVTIGIDDAPRLGAVLDLQSEAGNLGLVIPQSMLTSATEWSLAGSAIEGMAVFNSSESTADGLSGKGIYVWVSGSWNKMGAMATPCTPITVAPTTVTSFVGLGAVQTLGVALTTGSPPYNFTWKKGGVVQELIQNTSDYQSNFTTSEYGTYVFEATNNCTNIPVTETFVVSDIDIGDFVDDGPAATAGITWSLAGATCFDVRTSLVASSSYALPVTGATVTDVTWLIDDVKSVQSSPASTSNSGATLNFKPQATVSGLAPAEIVINALVTMMQGANEYKVSVERRVKFQEQSCCEGAIIYNGAYTNAPLLSGQNGDWSSSWTGTGFTAKGQDLCWNKTDASASTMQWAPAVSSCSGDWRLPNLRELHELYKAMGGAGGSTVSFAGIPAGLGSNPGSATNMVSSTYWSSTEGSATSAYNFNFSNGNRGNGIKTGSSYVRCVRDL